MKGLALKTPLLSIAISAFLFGISPPLAKLLVGGMPPMALAGVLYLGAFIGLSLYSAGKKVEPEKIAEPLERKDLPWLAGSILTGGIIAPISLMKGLTLVSGMAASLLLNLEGIATAVIAVFLFKESAGRRLWSALACMTLAGMFLTWQPDLGEFNIAGPSLIALAMACWGMDNNLTGKIADKDPVQIARIKGLVAGTFSISAALILGVEIPLGVTLVFALLLGAFSYGISMVFFIKALKGLGSFRTGVFFSFAPYIGVIASVIILGERIGWVILPATAFMAGGLWLLINRGGHFHLHDHEPVIHNHLHVHDDMHHLHEHFKVINEPHAHEHVHDEVSHIHVHWPDECHRHEH